MIRYNRYIRYTYLFLVSSRDGPVLSLESRFVPQMPDLGRQAFFARMKIVHVTGKGE